MDIPTIIKKISSGVTEIIHPEFLEKKLYLSQKNKKPLHIKAGFDPTAPDLHFGHVVLLRKIRQLQELGHSVFFIIGDFTAQIGDPSGRDQIRVKMSPCQVAKNARTYQRQVFKILDRKKTRVVFNSRWLKKLTAQSILELSSYCTVAQMLARADFKKRMEDQKEISMLEFIYPLLQGYDSVHLRSDIELGGSDQKFNLLMGRQLQEAFGQDPQVVIMMPLLEGTDGVQKMSKSLKNYIGVEESPSEMFGKIMSIPDNLMKRYYDLLTDMDFSLIEKDHPRENKLRLAHDIVRQFHTSCDADQEKKNFVNIFSKKELPGDVKTYKIDLEKKYHFLDLMINEDLVSSRNEARRLISQGAVTLNSERILDENEEVRPGILKVGKRRFLKII